MRVVKAYAFRRYSMTCASKDLPQAYILYTDGSADTVTRAGAYAYAILDESKEMLSCCAEAVSNTTNNAMELTAVLEGLKQCDRSRPVEVVSDSAYVVNCFLQQWYVKWRKNNWYASSGPVKNVEIWKELLAVAESFEAPILWTHIRGHRGNYWNEYVDKMCNSVRKKRNQ